MHRRHGIGVRLAIGWIALLVFLAVFADLLPLRDPEALGVRTQEVGRFESPGSNAWFGGDAQGRDLFSRVVYGVRPALILGLTATSFAALVGTIVGIAAGHYRGVTDRVVSGLIDLALAFPALVLLIAVRATFGNSITVLVVIFSILGIPAYARIVRATAMSVSEREFVDAARSMGASDSRIVFRELLPIIVRPVLSYAVIGFAIVLVAEGGLAFIGLSLDEVTWGRLIADGQAEIRHHPFLSLIPATVMFVTILAFNVVGDTLRVLGSPRQVATDRRMEVIGDRVGDDAAVRAPEPRSPTILRIRDLHTYLDTPYGRIEAVAGVDLSLRRGEALGVVGESGSGKTMLLRSIVGSFPLASVARSGTVDVEGTDMLRAPGREVRTVLGTTVGMVSQNPLDALNPVRRIGTQITEPMMLHRGLSRSDARAKALDLLVRVGIPAADRRIDQYPHQLSGGMRQRVTIAIALANDPDLLLADEPTTALDVTVQDQILRLLAGLRSERDMALVLVTHDLAVVHGFTDRVAVMYGGQIVETGPTEEIFSRPRHHYTKALLDSIPDLTKHSHSELVAIAGSPPSLLFPPPGCRFAPRCPAARDDCLASAPELSAVSDNGMQPHAVSCWHPVTIGVRQEDVGV